MCTSLNRRWKRLLVATLLVSVRGFGQSAESARERFAHGVERAQQNDFSGAIDDFEAAYRLRPNYVVLYNLGQAYVALGRHTDALTAFQSYLDKGGTRMPPARRREVQELIAASKQKVGYIALDVAENGAEVWIDGQSVGKTPLKAVSSLIGAHGVTVTLFGYLAQVTQVQVRAQETTRVPLRLTPLPTPAAPLAQGQLLIESTLPEVTVLLDGAAARLAPSEPFLVNVGTHRVTCQRDDYGTVESRVDVVEAVISRVQCDLDPVPRVSPARVGIVSLLIHEAGASVFVDGRRSTSTARLPIGAHLVQVRREGFVEWSQQVTLRAGFPKTIEVALLPTAEHAKELADRVRSRRNWSYAIGGGGLAVLGTGIALYANNSQRYSSWTHDRDALSRDIEANATGPALNQRASDVRERAVSIQRQDDIAFTASILGGALLSYAIVSWISAK